MGMGPELQSLLMKASNSIGMLDEDQVKWLLGAYNWASYDVRHEVRSMERDNEERDRWDQIFNRS